LPVLSRAQARVLALWSYGMVLAQSCGLTSVATVLAGLLDRHYDAVRQQLREWRYDAADKQGQRRTAVAVQSCFGPLLAWILRWWPADERRLALAMDASTHGERFTVLAVSVLYRGCALPVAWVVVPAHQKGSWRPHWEGLFSLLAPQVPADWTVIVLADRGLYARWLFVHLQRLGWQPFLRINQGGKVRPLGCGGFRPLGSLVPQVGTHWSGVVDCFANPAGRLRCTLLAGWSAPHADPWLVLTDLPPAAAAVAWYSLRFWIECGFKDTKRGGWHWEQTKTTDPVRASRHWLAIAVATLWVVSVGGEVDATLPVSNLEALPALHVARRHPCRRSQPRLLSCFRQGILRILVALINGRPLPLGRFIPESWPAHLPATATLQVPLQEAA
jgi:hypothetical protein